MHKNVNHHKRKLAEFGQNSPVRHQWKVLALFMAFSAISLLSACGDEKTSGCNDTTLALCEKVNCDDHGVCAVTTTGKAQCICDPGYQNSVGDLLHCEKTDPRCDGITCDSHGVCIIDGDNPKCYCHTGYQSPNDEPLHCIEVPVQKSCENVICSGHGTCVMDETKNAPVCRCDDGYVTHNDTKCVSKDYPCDDNCEKFGTCSITTEGETICFCHEGYHHPEGDLTSCHSDESRCEMYDCDGHGTCFKDDDYVLKCYCDKGYYSPEGDYLHCIEDKPVQKTCDGITCSGHGTCVMDDTTHSPVCQCENGYERIHDTKCVSESIDPNADENHNYMRDKYETAEDQGKDCLDGHNTTCIDGFCDSFIGYKCSTKCTNDSECISDEYMCRSDGRCAPKEFVIVWNIKRADWKTISFPGGHGTGCNFNIDWGDGSTESFDHCQPIITHDYAKIGEYTIKVTGTIINWSCNCLTKDLNISFGSGAKPSYDDCADKSSTYNLCGYGEGGAGDSLKIISFGPVGLGPEAFAVKPQVDVNQAVDIPNSMLMTNMSRMFYAVYLFCIGDACSATPIPPAIGHWDTSRSIDMSFMFSKYSSFNEDISHWDTSKVKNMANMFAGAGAFNQSLEFWDVSHLESYKDMFTKSALSQENWNKMKANPGWSALDETVLGIPNN